MAPGAGGVSSWEVPLSRMKEGGGRKWRRAESTSRSPCEPDASRAPKWILPNGSISRLPEPSAAERAADILWLPLLLWLLLLLPITIIIIIIIIVTLIWRPSSQLQPVAAARCVVVVVVVVVVVFVDACGELELEF